MQAKTKYALSGTAAGLVNGLFGGGGGMVLVPLLNGWPSARQYTCCGSPSTGPPRCHTSSADWWAVWWADGCSAASASHGCGDCSPPFCCTAA